MPPRYVIHIGPMKTGSTYLQKCLTQARPALRRLGVLLPQDLAGPNQPIVHRRVLSALRQPQHWEEARQAFQRLNESGARTVLLTDEFLADLSAEEVARLPGLMGDVPDVRIVYAVRRWSDRLPSQWFQHVFFGGTLTLPEWLGQQLRRKTGAAGTAGAAGAAVAPGNEVAYARVWRRWAEVFGRQGIVLFPFSTVVDAGDDPFDRFCADVLEIAPPAVPARGQKAWTSAEPRETELARALNMLAKAQAQAQGQAQAGGQTQSASQAGGRGAAAAEPGADAAREAALRLTRRRPGGAFLSHRRRLGGLPAFSSAMAAMAGHETAVAIDDADPSFGVARAAMSTWRGRLTGGATRFFAPRTREAAYVDRAWMETPAAREALAACLEALLADAAEGHRAPAAPGDRAVADGAPESPPGEGGREAEGADAGTAPDGADDQGGDPGGDPGGNPGEAA